MPAADHLRALMSAPRHPGLLGPEHAFQVEAVLALRQRTLDGRLRCVWSAVEAAVPLSGKAALIAQMQTRARGVIAGVPDLAFWWGSGSGFIELKRGNGGRRIQVRRDGSARLVPQDKGRLTPLQQDFQAWCAEHGVRHAVVHDLAGVLATLRQWGVLEEANA